MKRRAPETKAPRTEKFCRREQDQTKRYTFTT